jgi:hypothetical protein
MTMIDNVLGLSAGNPGAESDDKDIVTELNDNIIYGASELPDCPTDGGYCFNLDKVGYWGNNADGERFLHPPKEMKMPYDKPGSGSWTGKFVLNRNTFIGFGTSEQGQKSTAIKMNLNPDYTHPHYFFDTHF